MVINDAFTADGFTDDGFINENYTLITLSQAISFLYNSSQAGTSFSKDKIEIKDTKINVKIT